MKLPVGLSDFQKVIEGGHEFVDKSLFIQDVLGNTAVRIRARLL